MIASSHSVRQWRLQAHFSSAALAAMMVAMKQLGYVMNVLSHEAVRGHATPIIPIG